MTVAPLLFLSVFEPKYLRRSVARNVFLHFLDVGCLATAIGIDPNFRVTLLVLIPKSASVEGGFHGEVCRFFALLHPFSYLRVFLKDFLKGGEANTEFGSECLIIGTVAEVGFNLLLSAFDIAVVPAYSTLWSTSPCHALLLSLVCLFFLCKFVGDVLLADFHHLRKCNRIAFDVVCLFDLGGHLDILLE